MTSSPQRQPGGWTRVKSCDSIVLAILFLTCIAFPGSSEAQTDLHKVNHIIVVMQENHSFDNYFGALTKLCARQSLSLTQPNGGL